ncbi:hypothetical protein PAXRUDRAFT_169548, partial [Paxillus rubicundulus Ve08.2h10]
VDSAIINHVRELHTPPSHPVFELVPVTFQQYAQLYYDELGAPPVTHSNVWDVYQSLLSRFQEWNVIPANLIAEWSAPASSEASEGDDHIDIPLLADLQELPFIINTDGSYYMGEVNNGHGLGL